ncbi:TetR/AcrR family transcriptional regulator [Nocardia lijiangensis]|uniref:TetR/AcrR family transcriptional regulator n=1 Tax=Nocardia lijiangensis TaxID=299618 RepID=UPI00082B52EC|nr:TetR/AcrR family transcriptional regulator [Nocardia lijiangensis]
MRQVKKPEVRKAEIVDAAVRSFVERGYDQTTVESITGGLGVAKGCFYHYFGSKEQVFAAAIESIAQRLCATYLAILQNDSRSPSARLVSYIDHGYALTERDKAPGLLAALHGDRFRDMHHRIVDRVGDELRPALCALVSAGAAQGEFRIRDSEFTAIALLGALRELHEVYAERPDLDLRVHRATLVDLLERMLGTTLPHSELSHSDRDAEER